jgi:hypothetical protein
MQHFEQNPLSHDGQKYPLPPILFKRPSGLYAPVNGGLLLTIFSQLLHFIYFSLSWLVGYLIKIKRSIELLGIRALYLRIVLSVSKSSALSI